MRARPPQSVAPIPETGPAEAADEASSGIPGRIPLNHRVPSFLAFRFYQLCLGIMSEVLAPDGLKTTEYGALTMLDAEPGLDQQSLAARLGIDKVSAGQLVDRLERDGFVSRAPHPTDRRAKLLTLTPQGLALRRRIQPAALAAQDRILAPLREEERQPLIGLLTRIIEGHGAYARPGNGRSPPRKRPSSN